MQLWWLFEVRLSDCRISMSSLAAQNGPAISFICREFLYSNSRPLFFIVFDLLEYTST